jgi:N-acetylglucosamine kinase-like BadF-type ATPase
MQFFLGIDGGQSSTTALIGEQDGRVVGLGKGGPCNHVGAAEGRAKFFSAVGACVEEACARAGVARATVTFASACLGFSGGAEDKEAYSRELIRSRHYKITHDAEIALTGALEGEAGLIVIAGTGSMAFARNAEGRTARAGGWGYIFGDEGGAFDVTRQALRAALAFEEGWGPPTKLLSLLLEASEAKNANELLHRFYADTPRSDIARYAPLVSRAAESGDGPARLILLRCADQLARYGAGVHHAIFSGEAHTPVSYIGGVFRNELIRSEFSRRMHELVKAEVTHPRFGPAAGALLEAFRSSGYTVKLTNVPESEK